MVNTCDMIRYGAAEAAKYGIGDFNGSGHDGALQRFQIHEKILSESRFSGTSGAGSAGASCTGGCAVTFSLVNGDIVVILAYRIVYDTGCYDTLR